MHHPLAILELQRSEVLYAALPLRHDIYIPATGEKKNQMKNREKMRDRSFYYTLFVLKSFI
jgi:hypothetical protein